MLLIVRSLRQAQCERILKVHIAPVRAELVEAYERSYIANIPLFFVSNNSKPCIILLTMLLIEGLVQ